MKTPIWHYETESPCVACSQKNHCPHIANKGMECSFYMDTARAAYKATKEEASKKYFTGLNTTIERLNKFVRLLDSEAAGELDFAMEAIVDMATDAEKELVVKACEIFTALTMD